jgi:hypothetical protein
MKYSLVLLFIFFGLPSFQQPVASSKNIFFKNEKIEWAASYQSIVNLTAETTRLSVKKWWLQKIKTDTIANFTINENGSVKRNTIDLRSFGSTSLMSSFYIKSSDRPESWEYINRNTGERFNISGTLSNDSCCGCDLSDAFRVKQLISFSDHRFHITNLLLSPLCLRLSPGGGAWYAPGNFSQSEQSEKTAGAKYITSSEVTYPIDHYDSTEHFETQTGGKTMISSLLMNELLKGDLSAFDPQTKKAIPKDSVTIWRMPVDTIAVYDTSGMITYRISVQSIIPEDITVMRILQDWFFDPETGNLYSEARSVTVLKKLFSHPGMYRGMIPLYTIPLTKKK